MFIKGIVDNGWYWKNPTLGAPNGLEMYDFPAVDNSAAIIIALIGLFTNHPFLILNIFYLLTFPLVTISALYVFRRLNVSYPIALFGALRAGLTVVPASCTGSNSATGVMAPVLPI